MVLKLKTTKPGSTFAIIQKAVNGDPNPIYDLYVDGDIKDVLTDGGHNHLLAATDRNPDYADTKHTEISVGCSVEANGYPIYVTTTETLSGGISNEGDEVEVGQEYQLRYIMDEKHPDSVDHVVVRDYDEAAIDHWLEKTDYERYIGNVVLTYGEMTESAMNEMYPNVTMEWNAFTPDGPSGEPAVEVGIGFDGEHHVIFIEDMPEDKWELLRIMDFISSVVPEMSEDEEVSFPEMDNDGHFA